MQLVTQHDSVRFYAIISTLTNDFLSNGNKGLKKN